MRERRFYYWFMWAAVVLLVAATFHMFLMHMFKTLEFLGVQVGEPLEWQEVVRRAKDGAYLTLLFFLLTAALYHGTYGLRSVLIELTSSKKAQRIITWALAVIGLAAYLWGLYFLFASVGLRG